MKHYVVGLLFFFFVLFSAVYTHAQNTPVVFTDRDVTTTVSGDVISGTVNAGKINDLQGKKLTIGIKIFPSGTSTETINSGATYLQILDPVSPQVVSGSPEATYSVYFQSGKLDPEKIYPFTLTLSVEGEIKLTKTGAINTGKGVVATQKKIDLDLGKKSYRLLAPIPGISMLLDPDICEAKKIEDPKTICDINDFVNFVFKLMIGLAAVVLVVRLIIEGYVYMTTDVLFLKAGAKKTFFEALLGLVVALASYLILNTINPKLVDSGLDIPTSTFEIDEERDSAPTINDGNVIPPTGPVAQCSSGIEKITTKGGVFYACKDISAKFKSMIDEAWAQGIKISGGGFRTKESQIKLRRQNCGGTSDFIVFQKPSKSCKPPTARPGHSVHESGKAFDLTCDGNLINWDNQNLVFKRNIQTKKCFDWLQKNASRFGFYNLPSENWHWSTNGR